METPQQTSSFLLTPCLFRLYLKREKKAPNSSQRCLDSQLPQQNLPSAFIFPQPCALWCKAHEPILDKAERSHSGLRCSSYRGRSQLHRSFPDSQCFRDQSQSVGYKVKERRFSSPQ